MILEETKMASIVLDGENEEETPSDAPTDLLDGENEEETPSETETPSEEAN